MRCRKTRAGEGFTLIELLVVISIIGMLSSVVMAAASSARQKATDSKFIQEMYALRTALNIYYSNTGELPPGGADFYGSDGLDTGLAPLVTAGILSKIPHHPSWVSGNGDIILPSGDHVYVELWTSKYQQYKYEVMCEDMTYSDWKPGSQPGVLAIVTYRSMPFPAGLTYCSDDPEHLDCTRITEVGFGNYYCIQVI